MIRGNSVLSFDIEAVVEGRARLTFAQAIELYHHANLTDLGRWATRAANRMLNLSTSWSGITEKNRTYVIDRNINYTNVCSANCTFCAFKRDLGEEGNYTLSTEELHQKIRELVNAGGTQILLQGGMHPELPIEYYEEMLRGIKREFPMVHIHGFSPPEFVEFVAIFKLDNFPVTAPNKSHELPSEIWKAKLEAIIARLMKAGLDSIPGGGGEIFATEVRRRIGLGKATAQQWLDVMSAAHRVGMFTSATMMFGHIEGVADRIDHMQRVRDAQDLAIKNNWPGKYVSFIAWPFQRENTPLGRLKEWDLESPEAFPGDLLADQSHKIPREKNAPQGDINAAGKRLRMAGATEYLRTQAIARLFLDNIHSIGASWVTMGPKIGQLALFYGATDMGSVMMEENVVSAAGTTYCLSEELICRLIRTAGFTPAQRDNRYRTLKIHDGNQSPDLKVTDWSKLRAAKLHHETPGIHAAQTQDHDDTTAVHLPISGDKGSAKSGSEITSLP